MPRSLVLTALVAYVFTDDPVSFLLITANGVGYAAGATARNSSRPRIAIAQLVVLLVPVVVGTALRPQLKQFPAYLNWWDSQQARNEGVFAH